MHLLLSAGEVSCTTILRAGAASWGSMKGCRCPFRADEMGVIGFRRGLVSGFHWIFTDMQCNLKMRRDGSRAGMPGSLSSVWQCVTTLYCIRSTLAGQVGRFLCCCPNPVRLLVFGHQVVATLTRCGCQVPLLLCMSCLQSCSCADVIGVYDIPVVLKLLICIWLP